MKLEVIVNKKRGVINITSEQFIIEDLKSHVCKKLELSESDFKVKIHFGECPSMELIKRPSLMIDVPNQALELDSNKIVSDWRKMTIRAIWFNDNLTLKHDEDRSKIEDLGEDERYIIIPKNTKLKVLISVDKNMLFNSLSKYNKEVVCVYKFKSQLENIKLLAVLVPRVHTERLKYYEDQGEV